MPTCVLTEYMKKGFALNDERLRNEGREDILAYGIAFHKKRCKAVCERL